MHTCEICGWTTNRIGNLRAHLAKQKKCKPPPVQEPEPLPPVTLHANQCYKCEKILSTALCLKKHISICKGCHIIQCPTCLKRFNHRATKHHHIKNVKCEPAIIPETIQEAHDRVLYDDKKLKINMECEPVIVQKTEHEAYNRVLLKEIHKLTNELDLRDREIENLIELAFEDEKLPKVMKPKPKPKVKRTFVTAITRLEVASSQSWCCSICTKTLPAYFEIDHTIPLWNDGDDKLENVTDVCVACHSEKTHNERKLHGDMKYLNYIE